MLRSSRRGRDHIERPDKAGEEGARAHLLPNASDAGAHLLPKASDAGACEE